MMERKFELDTLENRAFLKELGDELLRFGVRFAAPCGASYYLGDDGTPWTDRDLETWITCRMAHVYSMGAMMGFAQGRKLAADAICGISGALADHENGGWYPAIAPDLSPRPEKQCYCHAFVILAASSALLANVDGAKELLDEALAVYDRFFWDETEGLARDTYDTAFSTLDSYRGLNANMHTVEAFLAVADATKDETYRVRAGRIIDRVLSWAEENQWRIPEHFTEDWVPDLEKNKERPDDPFKPYGATPGHGIEWARLIAQWTLSSLGSDGCVVYINNSEQLFLRAINDAWNSDGAPGIVYTTDWSGTPVVRDRMHWTLAEAINTSAVLYRVTGKDIYKDYYAQFMEYLEAFVHDEKNGSWFHQLDENNQPKGTVWPGKSDLYHAFQATLIPYADPAISIASAIKRRKNDEE